jgi:hypothetical protein
MFHVRKPIRTEVALFILGLLALIGWLLNGWPWE